MIPHNFEQGSPEWRAIRNRNFTASGLGSFVLEPVKISLTVDEIKAELDARGINRSKLTKKDDLLAILPNKERYAELCDGARTAIIKQIKSERMQSIRDQMDAYNSRGELFPVSALDDLMLSREEELAMKEEKSFEHNIAVRYGNIFEPYAREFYQKETGCEVTQVGFIEHGDGTSGFGCSPDGLVYDKILVNEEWVNDRPIHGLEIKCPIPETHMAWLENGRLPSEHKIQVHASMVCSGLGRWDFLSFCPGWRPLLITVHRDEDTEKVEAGLKILVAEKAKMIARLNGKGAL